LKLKLKGCFFLSLFLMAFITGFIVLPAAHGTLGSASTPVDDGGTAYLQTMTTDQGNLYFIDGWLYGLGTGVSGTTWYRQWKSSDDGANWNTAATGLPVDSSTAGNSKYKAYSADSVYDEVGGSMYVAWAKGTGSYDRAFWFTEYTPVDGVMLLTQNHSISYWNSSFVPSQSYQMLCSITLMDGKPVIAGHFWNHTGVGTYDWVNAVWFAHSAHPTSYLDWTSYEESALLGYTDRMRVDVHAVNSTTVLLLFKSMDQDMDWYGYFVGESTGFEGAASFVTVTDKSVDHLEDSNSYNLPMSSAVSRNSENPQKYADMISIAYVDTLRNVYFDQFNVSTRTIERSELVENGTIGSYYNAWNAGIAKSGLNFYVEWANKSGSANDWHWYLRERDENGIWGSELGIYADRPWQSSDYPTLLMSQTILETSSIFGSSALCFMEVDYNGGTDNEVFFYVNASGVPEPVYWEGQPPYVTAAELENIDSGLDWVFTEWKYYTFTLNVPNPILDVYGNLTDVGIRFNVTTGEEEIQCDFHANNTDRLHIFSEYSLDDWTWSFNSSMTSELETRTGEPVILQAGTVSYDTANNETDITFQIFFRAQCLDSYVSPGINVSARVNWLSYSWDWFDADFSFYLYSKGGFAKNFASSDFARANNLYGEEWAAMYAYNGTNVYNEIWFRDLQHVKLLPVVEGYAGLDPFSITITMDYSVGEGEWLPGWMMVMQPVTVHWSGLFAQEVWINMTVKWYQGEGTPGSYTLVKTDNLYMFFHGSVTGSGQTFRYRFWFDGWFNSINASSTGGGRINAFEYPMKDNADLWFRWLANNWGVKDDVEKESTYMADLKDTNNQIMSSERIKMVRCGVRLTVFDADAGQLIYLHNYEVMDYTHSKELPLHGIQTPVFDDTKMPDVGQTGLLGAIFSMFAGIGQWLSENVMFGGLNLWGNFVAFLDTIAGWLGAPKFFTNLFNWIGSGFSYMIQSATYVFTLLYNFFLMIGQLIGAFITTLGEFVLSIINTLGYLVDFLGGIGTGAGSLWVQFNIMGWLEVALVFYPLYLIILWDQEGMDAVVSQLSIFWGIAAWLFGFFIQIIMAVISFAHTLIESIPVAE